MPARSASSTSRIEVLVSGGLICHDGDEMAEYKTGASTKHSLLTHLVWCPKYRRRILRGKVARRLMDLFVQAAEINDWEITELKVQKDHIHMLIQTNPSESIASVVQRLKRGSSYIIRKEYPELEEFLWGRFY